MRYADAYAEGKRARAALDFDDLELLARDLLRDTPGIRASYAERFERVMVDEFQDTNATQLGLLELLGSDRFVVGDELQSIYSFRHADVRIFRAQRAALAAGRRGSGAGRQLPQPPGHPRRPRCRDGPVAWGGARAVRRRAREPR